jgi:hypothetical protein
VGVVESVGIVESVGVGECVGFSESVGEGSPVGEGKSCVVAGGLPTRVGRLDGLDLCGDDAVGLADWEGDGPLCEEA